MRLQMSFLLAIKSLDCRVDEGELKGKVSGQLL